MQQVIACGPTTVVHERLTSQALMQLGRSAVAAMAVEQPLGGQ